MPQIQITYDLIQWPLDDLESFAPFLSEVLDQDKDDEHFWRPFGFTEKYFSWTWWIPFYARFWTSPFQVSDERVNMMQHSNAWLARVWQLTPTQKNLVPRFGFLREEGGVFKSKTILPFPSCFIFRMVRPLNFEELDVMTSRGTLGLIEDTNGVGWRENAN